LQQIVTEGQSTISSLSDQNRTLDIKIARYEGSQDELRALMQSAIRGEAEKTHRIGELEKQKDLQAQLIIDLQTRQNEMAIALGLKDEALKHAEQKNAAQEEEIKELKESRAIDREKIGKLQEQLDQQKARIDELESINKTLPGVRITPTDNHLPPALVEAEKDILK